MALAKSAQLLSDPSNSTVLRAVGIVEVQDRACMKTSVPPRLPGCSGFPSILVGRPMWLSTSKPVATPACGIEVA